MRLDDAKELAKKLMDKHGLLPDWQFRFNRMKTAVGRAHSGFKIIELSRHYTEINSLAFIKDTLLHEIAHALVGSERGHDEVWKAKAKEIGAKPVAGTHGQVFNSPQSKYIGSCGCPRPNHAADRRPKKGYFRECRKCKERIEWRVR